MISLLPIVLAVLSVPQAVGAAPLELELRLELGKSVYLRREPLIFDLSLTNPSDRSLEIRYPIRGQPGWLEVRQVRGDGSLGKELGRQSLVDGGVCPVGGLPEELTWRLVAGQSQHARVWNENRARCGRVRVQARVLLAVGSDTAAVTDSAVVTIEVREPSGIDAAALALIEGRETVRLEGHGSVRVRDGLVPDSGSHLRRPSHEYFVEHHGGSVYADYVRSTMAGYVQGLEERCRLLEEILDGPHTGYPLREESRERLRRYERWSSARARTQSLRDSRGARE